MKIRRLLSIGLAAVMAVSAISISALADDEAVCTYIDDSGERVNITQADLDVEHWNKNALEGAAPMMYADFPMSIDTFVNDFAEVSADLIYMKNLDAFDKVHVTIADIDNGETIYDEDMTTSAFYSPNLQSDKRYTITLTETIGAETSEYQKLISVEKAAAEMPEYVASGESDEVISVAKVSDLRANQTVTESGEIVIDARVNPSTAISADELQEYIADMGNEEIYRVTAHYDNEYYFGFVNGNDADNIYTYNIIVSDIDILNAPSMLSTPSSITFSNVKSTAAEIAFEDTGIYINDSTSSPKFRSYVLYLYDELEYLDTSHSEHLKLQMKLRGDVSVGTYMWVEVDGVAHSVSITPNSTSTTRTFTIDLENSSFGIKSSSEVNVYAAVYFPYATKGYGMITPTLLTGFDDDVTGSMFEAYNDSSNGEQLEFKEYTITDGRDVDMFALKKTTDCYKVTIKNRSAKQQKALEQGQVGTGAREKIITAHEAYTSNNSQATDPGNIFRVSETPYTVPRNADITIYCYGSASNMKSFVSVRATSIGIGVSSPYLLSYEDYIDNGVIES